MTAPADIVPASVHGLGRVSAKVAIVSDPLVQRGGAERCVEVMARTFPDAPIFTLLYSAATGPASLEARVVPSVLQRIPGAAKRHRWLLPLYPAAVESFDLSGYDIILSSHHTAAKGIRRDADQVHICYCHTPMRALWERSVAELETLPRLIRPLARSMFGRIRVWDYITAGRVDTFIANSRTTQRRIAKHYGRASRVLHPPIDVERFTPGADPPGDYYLVVSRLVPYKRVDLAVAATASLGRRLVVVGGGPGVQAVAGHPHVDYRGYVPESELLALMRQARAMILPAYEDFGMAAVEMMACGRPVIAYGRGGAAETVVDGVTGVLAEAQTVEAFAAAIERCEQTAFVSPSIRRHAEAFSEERFQAGLLRAVEESGWQT